MTGSMEGRKRWLALVVLCLGVLIFVLDTTIVNVARPSLRADLHFTESSLVWVVNAAFMLGAVFAAVATLVGASLLRVGLHANAPEGGGMQGAATA